jgi:hypothetical protein
LTKKVEAMGVGTILFVILVLALLGALPVYPYSSGWGYGPSGIVGVLVVILLILLLTGRV